jgi:hypothetical protein
VFGQIADTLDKWLNRPFLLAYFSPWLVFAFANGVMAYVAFPPAAAQINRYVHGNPADKAIVIAVAIAVIAVVAYVSSLLLRGMTKLLEGQWLPEWLADQLDAIVPLAISTPPPPVIVLASPAETSVDPDSW